MWCIELLLGKKMRIINSVSKLVVLNMLQFVITVICFGMNMNRLTPNIFLGHCPRSHFDVEHNTIYGFAVKRNLKSAFKINTLAKYYFICPAIIIF